MTTAKDSAALFGGAAQEPLFECHGHIISDGADTKKSFARHTPIPDDAQLRATLAVLREAGVVFYRDGGDRYGVSCRAKTLAPEYGIDYRTPGFLLYKKGRYGGLYGEDFSDAREFTQRVRYLARSVADFIKIAVSGIVDFATGGMSCPALEYDEIAEMIKIAHGEGFAVMCHASGREAVTNAVLAGADSIEHGIFADDEAIYAMRENGCVWVPTVTALTALAGRPEFSFPALPQIIAEHIEAVKRAAALGVLLASGSDAGSLGVFQGRGAAREAALLRNAGIFFDDGNKAISERFTPQ
ncbi:MAG: amidohydrolase family protein [Oscillospiraceae bacterium]|jgi:hypothetical protein|nr:amidohydrolase family protein [Oscillospiraceae bacterium]